MGEHIHSKCHDVNISRSLAVSEAGAFYSVSACEQTHFAVCNRAASVVVRVERNDKVLPVVHSLAHILYLLSVNVRH